LRQGTLTKAFEQLAPAFAAAKSNGQNEPANSTNSAFVNLVAQEHVALTLAEIKQRCPALAAAEEQRTVDLVGAFYDVQTGEVMFSDIAPG
jgi:carbonic anhydrase